MGDELSKANGSGKGNLERPAEKQLPPNAIRLDQHGVPIDASETALPQRQNVEVINWTQWLAAHGHSQQVELAKTVLYQACLVVHPMLPNADVAILRKGETDNREGNDGHCQMGI